MNKEEILQKSREENKNLDIYELEVIRKGQGIAANVAIILAGILFLIGIIQNNVINYGLCAIACSIPSICFIIKSIYLKRKHEIVLAIFYTFITILLSIAYINNLILF